MKIKQYNKKVINRNDLGIIWKLCLDLCNFCTFV